MVDPSFGESQFFLSKTMEPGDFVLVPDEDSILVNYEITVTVYDNKNTPIVKRNKSKKFKITINGLTASSNLMDILDSLIGQTPLLPDNRSSDLYKCLIDMQSRIYDQKPMLQKQIPTKPKNIAPSLNKSTASQDLAFKLSKKEVDSILHNAIHKIHFGNEEEERLTLQSLVDLADHERNLTMIIQHEPLMNTLINSMKKYAKDSLVLCTSIMSIFEKMSYFRNFHSDMSRYKIGLATLNLFHSLIYLAQIAGKEMPKDKLAEFLKVQNGLLKLIVSLLF